MLGTTERPDGVHAGARRAPGHRVALAAAALAVALGLTACGSTDSSDENATPATNTAATSAAESTGATSSATAPAAAPTPAELQATLVKFSDPTVPTSEKTAMVVGGEQRTELIDQMNKALAGYGTLTYDVADVTTEGNTATAQVTVTSPHGAVPAMPMTWENVDGSWKLSDKSGCLLLGFAQAPCAPA